MPAPLSVTVAALLENLLDTTPGAALRVTSLTVDLPVEAAMARTDSGAPAVLIGPPRWRWRTAFDRPPGRLRLTVELSETVGGGPGVPR
jgi:hypothetical protein